MTLQKQSIDLSFSQGIDTKTDPFRLSVGKFLSLNNSVFDVGGRLTKRNGYNALTALGSRSFTYLTTFNSNLTAVGMDIAAYSLSTDTWVTKGTLQPLDLKALPLVRNSTNQSQADSVTADNGLVCVAYTDQDTTNLADPIYRYAVYNSITGQNIISPTDLDDASSTYGSPRVFLLGTYFIIMYTTTGNDLTYIAVSTNDPTMVTAPADIAVGYTPFSTIAFDALSISDNDRLIIAYNTTSGGQSVKVTYLDANLIQTTPVTFATQIATMFSLCADNSTANPIIYVFYYDDGIGQSNVLAVNQNLQTILAPTIFTSGLSMLNMVSVAQNGVATAYFEVANNYGYNGSIPTHLIMEQQVTQAGAVSGLDTYIRSIGLASKAFLYQGNPYFLGIYQSDYQPTYFLIDGHSNVVSKLAASNAGEYYTIGLPNITLKDSQVRMTYFHKNQIQAITNTQGDTSPAIYAQLGVQLATFTFGSSNIQSAEIGSNLNLTGGYLSMYDGVSPVEQGFFVYPEYVKATWSATGGNMAAQPDGTTNTDAYFYQATYEWSDNQGNLFRSAPSLPVAVTTTGSGTTGSVIINVPTLRLTYKTEVPVRIILYRWSAANQSYHQVYEANNMTTDSINKLNVDYVTITDTLADNSIQGNNLIYTTGGVLENICPPATSTMCLFNNRLFLVDAEDRNLLWYSKQVIEATPVEMSDLLTLYMAPTTASQGSTGPITVLSPMDDKLIVFKENALGYINGIGPDNTGANGQYSDFILINSVVGCTNQQSVVFTPQGLMFQSAKGIWLLGRDLSTNYIGSPVEGLTAGANVNSAVNVPGSTQVRFTLDTGITLMYDYFYGQWGTFTNVPAISSTIYQSLHTYLNSFGQVLQEEIGSYLDNSKPVLMSFTTGWMNLAGVQGYERFYEMYMLGQYKSPFKLAVQFAYNYNPSPIQSTSVTPSNQSPAWGGTNLWGSNGSWGANQYPDREASANVFEARVFPKIQKCESFQISISEQFDSSYGQSAGEGLTLSGLNLIVGLKRNSRTSKASRNFG